MSRSKKRKLSEPLDEVDQLRAMVQHLGAKVRAQEVENDTLRLEKHGLVQAVQGLQKAMATVTAARPGAVHVNDLPDALLLRVLAELDVLFVADVVSDVCRRWRALARDPAIWSDVELRYANKPGSATSARLFARALAAAPALESLEVGLSGRDPAALHRALESCATTARHLCVDLETAAPDVVLQLLWNSRHCLQNFCLREGPVSPSSFSADQAKRFWQLIEAASELRSLVLFLSQRSGLASCAHLALPRAAGRSTLRTLFVDVGVVDVDQLPAGLSCTVESFIRAHRDTLLNVHLPKRVPTAGAMKALSRCGLLSMVSTPCVRDLNVLLGCGRLRELKLVVGPHPSPPLVRSAMEILAEMKQLEVLWLLQLPPLAVADAEVANDAVLLLQKLPQIRELGVTGLPSPAALDALTDVPLAAPQLQVLRFDRDCGEDVVDDGQGSPPCRYPAFRRLLQYRPGLHVVQSSLAVGPCCDPDHKNLDVRTPLPVALIGHVPGNDCRVCDENLGDGGALLRFVGLGGYDVYGRPPQDAKRASEEAKPTAGAEVSAGGCSRPSSPTPVADVPGAAVVGDLVSGVENAASLQTSPSSTMTSPDASSMEIRVLAIMPYETISPSSTVVGLPWEGSVDSGQLVGTFTVPHDRMVGLQRVASSPGPGCVSTASEGEGSPLVGSPPITVSIPLWKLDLPQSQGRGLDTAPTHLSLPRECIEMNPPVDAASTVALAAGEVNNNCIAPVEAPLPPGPAVSSPSDGGARLKDEATTECERSPILISPRRNQARKCRPKSYADVPFSLFFEDNSSQGEDDEDREETYSPRLDNVKLANARQPSSRSSKAGVAKAPRTKQHTKGRRVSTPGARAASPESHPLSTPTMMGQVLLLHAPRMPAHPSARSMPAHLSAPRMSAPISVLRPAAPRSAASQITPAPRMVAPTSAPRMVSVLSPPNAPRMSAPQPSPASHWPAGASASPSLLQLAPGLHRLPLPQALPGTTRSRSWGPTPSVSVVGNVPACSERPASAPPPPLAVWPTCVDRDLQVSGQAAAAAATGPCPYTPLLGCPHRIKQGPVSVGIAGNGVKCEVENDEGSQTEADRMDLS